MAHTYKPYRLWLKQEKRFIKLMYEKGLIPVEIEELFWHRFYIGCNRMKYLDDMCCVKNDDSYITIVVAHVLLSLYVKGLSNFDHLDVLSRYSYSQRYYGHSIKGIIEMLECMPTKRRDHEINKVLKVRRHVYTRKASDTGGLR